MLLHSTFFYKASSDSILFFTLACMIALENDLKDFDCAGALLSFH